MQTLADTEAQLKQREAASARAAEAAPVVSAVAASRPGVTQSLRTLAESYKPEAEAGAVLDFDLGLPMPNDDLRRTEADLSAERSKVAIAAKKLEEAVRARLVTEQRAKAVAKQQAALEADIDKITTAKIMLGTELEREEGQRKEVQGLLEAAKSARIEIDLRLAEAAAEQVRLKREAEVARTQVETARTETENVRIAAARAEQELKHSKTLAMSARAELAGRQREDETLKHELADMLARVASFEADLKRERSALASVEADLATVRAQRVASSFG